MVDWKDVRTPFEKMVDKILLIYLVSTMRKTGKKVNGNLKLQKMVFKTQDNMDLRKIKGFNERFYRYKMGPWSLSLASDATDLKNNDIFSRQEYAYFPTKRGMSLYENLSDIYKQNDKITSIIDQCIREHGEATGDELRKLTYDYRSRKHGVPISRVDEGEIVLDKMDLCDADALFYIDEQWIDTLEIVLEPAKYSGFQNALNDLKEGRESSYIPLSR
ncbi:MAG: hypothetical protein ACTSW1_05850 [Candidatus Hodarchaeales archaeon]